MPSARLIADWLLVFGMVVGLFSSLGWILRAARDRNPYDRNIQFNANASWWPFIYIRWLVVPAAVALVASLILRLFT